VVDRAPLRDQRDLVEIEVLPDGARVRVDGSTGAVVLLGE
jgi:hypothetical protein